MKAAEIRRIREDLNLNRDELAQILCLSGYQAMMNIETDFRKPSKLAIRLLRYIDSLPKAKALAFIEELKRYEPK